MMHKRISWYNYASSIIVVLFMLPVSFYCLGTDRQHKHLPNCTQVFFSWDLYNDSYDGLITISDSMKIVDLDGFRIFITDKHYDISLIKPGSPGSDDSEELLQQKILHQYFIFKPGSERGLVFDSENPNQFKSSDKQRFLGQNFQFAEEMFLKENDSLISRMDSDELLVEKYLPRKKPDETYADTSFLFYSHDTAYHYLFALAPKVDSLKKAKLVKAVFIYNEKANPRNHNQKIPKREFSFELRKLTINTENLIPLIEKAKRQI